MRSHDNDNTIHLEIVKRVFPLSILFLCVYAPYSLFFLHDYLAGWAQVFALVAHILCVSYYFKPENIRVVCNILISLGFPALLPWFFSGGPSGHALWWSPVYSLWVSYFATRNNYFIWVGSYVLIGIGIAVLGNLGYFTLANSNTELLNILFATFVGTLLIYFIEQIRDYYENLAREEAQQIIKIQERYSNLLESAPDAILVFDSGNKIVLANLQAEHVFGYAKDELIGCRLDQLIGIQGDDTQDLWQFFVESKENNQAKLRGKRKDGTRFSAEINTSVNEKEGTVTATIRDISERVLMINTLLKQNKQLESFTQMASHNLRGPVGNLNSLLYLYNDEESPEERAFLIDKFEKVVVNLEETLNELLEMVQLTHEQSNEKTLVTFESIFAKITGSFEHEIKQLNAFVSANFEKAPEVEYTNVYLESIMQNLLSNALKYRSPERDPKIHFETTNTNGQIVLRVSDNGSGINLKQNGDHIFGFHKTFHAHPDAKGIGLFITKSQVDSMGGEITVSSEVGIGTTFNIVFNKYTTHTIGNGLREHAVN